MIILAFESSCDETAVAVVEMSEGTRRILSSEVATQIATHALYGGVVPEIASRAHTEAISSLTRLALTNAGVTRDDVDAIAVTASPGLIGALLVGVNFAKGLASAWKKPLIPVNHVKGHAAAAYLAFPELNAPFFCPHCVGWAYLPYLRQIPYRVHPRSPYPRRRGGRGVRQGGAGAGAPLSRRR